MVNTKKTLNRFCKIFKPNKDKTEGGCFEKPLWSFVLSILFIACCISVSVLVWREYGFGAEFVLSLFVLLGSVWEPLHRLEGKLDDELHRLKDEILHRKLDMFSTKLNVLSSKLDELLDAEKVVISSNIDPNSIKIDFAEEGDENQDVNSGGAGDCAREDHGGYVFKADEDYRDIAVKRGDVCRVRIPYVIPVLYVG